MNNRFFSTNAVVPVLLTMFVSLFSGVLSPHILRAAALAPLSGALIHEMKYNDGPYPVVVFLKGESTPSFADSILATRRELMAKMQRLAEGSQKTFVRTFATRVSDIKRFWLVNAVAMKASREVIEQISRESSVKKIYFDGSVSIPPTRIEKEEAPKGGWTYGLKKIGIPEVRNEYGLTGKGVVMGLIDTGCDPDHPDIKGKLIGFKDFLYHKETAYDDDGHGTHCAGTMIGGNAGGTNIGVAPAAKLIVAKALGFGSTPDSLMLVAMEWMVDPDENPDTDDAPSVVNCSWGSQNEDTILWTAVENWIKLGIFPAFAAGNSGPGNRTIGIPASYPHSFAVGSTTRWDRASTFSSRGPVKWDGTESVKPDVAAPGSSIYSARTGGGYHRLSGTSMACPHVAGVIALIYEANPRISIDRIKEILESTAKDLGKNGKDNTYGSGRIKVPAAIAKVLAK